MYVFGDKQIITNIINGIDNVVVRALASPRREYFNILSPMKFKALVSIMYVPEITFIPGHPSHGEEYVQHHKKEEELGLPHNVYRASPHHGEKHPDVSWSQ